MVVFRKARTHTYTHTITMNNTDMLFVLLLFAINSEPIEQSQSCTPYPPPPPKHPHPKHTHHGTAWWIWTILMHKWVDKWTFRSCAGLTFDFFVIYKQWQIGSSKCSVSLQLSLYERNTWQISAFSTRLWTSCGSKSSKLVRTNTAW